MKHTLIYLSVDLESWASPNVPEFINLSSQEKKSLDNGNIRDSALHILALLKKYNVKLTFFIVGQLYDWYPEVVEMIVNQGHEIGYHTHAHDAATDKETLMRSLHQSKRFIQRFKPRGFRAPRLSITQDCLALLKDYGFTYDSSTYGPYEKGEKIAGMVELPVTSVRGIPIGSGFFIGLFGKKILDVYRMLSHNGNSIISFIHNWQILKPEKPSFPTKKYLFTHPHYLPYTVDCKSRFEYIVKNSKIYPMKNLLQ